MEVVLQGKKVCKNCGGPIPAPVGRKNWQDIRVYCGNVCRLRAQKGIVGKNIYNHTKKREPQIV